MNLSLFLLNNVSSLNVPFRVREGLGLSKRVALVALPFISLHPNYEKAVTAGGYLISAANFLNKAYHQQENSSMAYSAGRSILAVSTFFSFFAESSTPALALTTVSMFFEFFDCLASQTQEDWQEGLYALFSSVFCQESLLSNGENSLLYPEIGIELHRAYEQWQQGNTLEGYGHFLFSCAQATLALKRF